MISIWELFSTAWWNLPKIFAIYCAESKKTKFPDDEGKLNCGSIAAAEIRITWYSTKFIYNTFKVSDSWNLAKIFFAEEIKNVSFLLKCSFHYVETKLVQLNQSQISCLKRNSFFWNNQNVYKTFQKNSIPPLEHQNHFLKIDDWNAKIRAWVIKSLTELEIEGQKSKIESVFWDAEPVNFFFQMDIYICKLECNLFHKDVNFLNKLWNIFRMNNCFVDWKASCMRLLLSASTNWKLLLRI